MSLATRVTDLASRIAREFKVVRQEMHDIRSAGGPAGGVLGGTYPNPRFADNAVFDGRVVADGVIVQDGLDVRGINNKFSVGSVVTLHDKTAGPTNPPALTVDYSVAADLGGGNYRTQGIYLDTAETGRQSTGRYFQLSQLRVANKTWDWPLVGPWEAGGGNQSQYKAHALTRIQNASGARTIVWGEYGMQNVPGQPTQWRTDGMYLRSYDTAPISSDLAPTEKATVLKTTDFGLSYQHQLGRSYSVTGATRASEFCSVRVDIGTSMATLQRWSCEDAGGFVAVQTISSVSMPYVTAENECTGVAFGSSARMGFHGANQDVWVIFTEDYVYVHNAAATARVSEFEFPAAPGSLNPQFSIGNLATNDFAGFRGIPDADTIPMTRYTDISWPDTESAVWWVANTWYDSTGTTHETNLSVPGAVTMLKRARLLVDVGPLPDPAAGAGQARAADDVNSFRLYLARGAVQPASTAFYRQTLQPVALATTISVTANPVFTGAGLAPPATTDFPGAGPARIQSSGVSAFDGTRNLSLDANGLVEAERVDVGGTLLSGLTGRGFEQMSYLNRFQSTFTGGGMRKVNWSSPTAYLTWSSRFIGLGLGRGATLGTLGYFDIMVPPTNTVITGYGGAANKTVTTSGVPLGLWDSLWYELPFGSAQTSLPANFKVVNYTSDFKVPSNWVLIGLLVGDTGYYVQWGDGVKTNVGGWFEASVPNSGIVLARYAGEISPSSDAPNDGGERLAYVPGAVPVPAGSRTCTVAIQTKGRATTNAACYWYLKHNGAVIVVSRVHNLGDQFTVFDNLLTMTVNVYPGDSFQGHASINNDINSGSPIYLRPSYFSYTFMS